MSLMQDLGSYLGIKNKDLLNNLVSASGFTTKVKSKDRFQETSNPNVLVDKVGDDYVIDGVLYSQLGEELVTNGDFSDGLTGWNIGSFSIVNGQATITDTSTNDYSLDSEVISGFDTNKYYVISYEIVATTGGIQTGFYLRTSTGDSTGIADRHTNTGVKTFIFKPTDVSHVLKFYHDGGGSGDTTTFDNISVKELKTITKPLAVFDPNASDELLDDKVHGLICQQAHSKADIIVAGNELVTNGTFDSDTSGWTAINATISVSSGQLSVADNGAFSCAYQAITTVVGQSYTASFDKVSTTGGNYGLFYGTTLPNGAAYGDNAVSYNSNSGSFSFSFVAEGTTTYIAVISEGTFTSIYDNISVQLADSIYQAITDTNIGDSLTDANKFQVLEDVTRHDIVTMTANGYKSFKGIKHYTDQELVDGSHDLIASDRGWTKLGNNTYIDEDGDKVFIVEVLGSSLNAGAYHSVYNSFGTKYFTKDTGLLFAKWYESDVWNANSIYDAFEGSTPTETYWRPDSKFYDKFYTEGENGLLGLGYAYCFDDIDLEIDKNILKDYIQNGTGSSKLTVDTLADVSKTSWDLTEKAIEVHEVLYSSDSGVTWQTETFTADYINNQVTLGTARTDVKISYTSANTPQQGTPKEVLKVLDKVIASNSHSIHKDNLIVNAVSGGVATGNGANAYESKVLENTLLDENSIITTTPKHIPIELDNSDSKAGKWFYALSIKNKQYFFDIYYKELVWNGVDSYDDNGQFDDLSKCLSIPTGVYRK